MQSTSDILEEFTQKILVEKFETKRLLAKLTENGKIILERISRI